MKFLRIILAFLCLALLGIGQRSVDVRAAVSAPFSPPIIAPASLSASDVIAVVNELRRSQGLKAYTTDAGLMAYAQQHSDYQARIHQSTHVHSDGTTAVSRGLQENVAAGSPDFLTAQVVVYQIWADVVHMRTMVGYDSGEVGAGVAADSDTVYVTLNVRPSGAAVAPTLPGGTPGAPLPTLPAIVPVTTVTPKANGAVIHEVGYGQSLWAIAIAYGVTSDQIRSLNGMAPGSTDIYAGQKLLIIPAGAATATPVETRSAASQSGSPTLSLAISQATDTLFPTLTIQPVGALSPVAPTPQPQAGFRRSAHIDPFLAGLVVLCLAGLILFLTSGVKIQRGN